MSSILDALEKKNKTASESKPSRRIASGPPGIVAQTSPRSLPVLAIFAGVAFICFGAAYLAVLLADREPEEPVRTPEPALSVASVSTPAPETETIRQLASELASLRTLLDKMKSTPPPGAESAANSPGESLVQAPAPPKTDEVIEETVSPSPTPEPIIERDPPKFGLRGTLAAGGRNIANIRGRFYRAGDWIDGWEILEVGDGYVRLKGWEKAIGIGSDAQ